VNGVALNGILTVGAPQVQSGSDFYGNYLMLTRATGNNYASMLGHKYLSAAGNSGLDFHVTDNADVSTSAPKMTIRSSGNVGIGNSTPPIKLWVPGTSTTAGIGVYNGDVATIIGNTGGDINAGTIQVRAGGSSSTIGTTNYSLCLNPDGGNVGVGTNTAGYKLDVNGTIATRTDIRWNGTGLNASDKKLYSPADGDLEWMTNDGAGVHGFAVSHQGTKKVYLNTSGNSYLNGGNVGIGTTSPPGKLTVGTNGDAENMAVAAWNDRYFCVGQSVSATSSAVAIGFNNATASGWIYSLAPSTAWRSLNYGAANHYFYCASTTPTLSMVGANVGINNTAPNSALQVTGQFYQSIGNAFLGYDQSNQIFLGQNRSGVFCKLNDDMWFSDPQNGGINIRNGNDSNWGTLTGVFVNQSTRASKKDVTTFDQTKLESLYQDTIKTKVCSWHYKGDADYTPLKYGPILDDSPPYFTVTPDGESLYINQYVAMLHGALQVAIQKIESLETRLSTLENNTTQ
jgi:hypothetical protein